MPICRTQNFSHLVLPFVEKYANLVI